MSEYIAKGLIKDSGGSIYSIDSSTGKENRVGEEITIVTREGHRTFRWMKAESAFAIGQVSTAKLFIDNADVDAAATTSEKTLTATGDFTAGEFGNTYQSAFVTIDAGTGVGQTRAIERNPGSTSILTLDKVWDAALDATSDYVTYDVNYVAPGTTPGLVRGVAISAVTDEYFAWFQVKGFCPLIRAAGNTDPLVAGEPFVLSSSAGVVKGLTNAGTTADDVANIVGWALHAYAVADSAGYGAAGILDCH